MVEVVEEKGDDPAPKRSKKSKKSKRKEPEPPPKKYKPTTPNKWPFHMSGDDIDLLNNMKFLVRIWLDASGGFRLEELIAYSATLKIHDWYCYAGLLGAYCLQQCEGMRHHTLLPCLHHRCSDICTLSILLRIVSFILR